MANDRGPLVSVLIPSFNHGRFISQTIGSVLNQSYRNFELIIIDDGSSDNSWSLIESFSKRDHRIKSFRQDNQGLVKTLNKLFEISTGEFITHLGSDDLWMPQKLAWGVEEMMRDVTLSAAFTHYLKIDAYNMPIENIDPFTYRERYGNELISQLLVANNICALTAFIRRDSLEKCGPFARDLDSCQDWDLWLRLSQVGNLKISSQIGGFYRWHGGNMSAAISQKTSLETLWVLENVSASIAKSSRVSGDVINRLIMRIAQTHAELSDYDKCLGILEDQAEIKALDSNSLTHLLKQLCSTGHQDAAAILVKRLGASLKC